MNYRNLNKYSVHKNSMKKIGVILLFALSFLLFGFVMADNSTTNSTNITTTTVSDINKTNIQNGFDCLIEQVGSDCSGAKTIEEITLTILASPDGITDDCVNKLVGLEKTNCFSTSGSCDIKETAMAILALNHIGKDTIKYTDWLVNQTAISQDLTWYMQQNSEGATTCEVSYDSDQYEFSVNENKKLSNSAGNCLDLTQSNYWFMISSDCYEKKFTMNCLNDFVATLMYKQPDSQTIYILSDTQSANANNPIDLQVKSVCFGKGSCDYEASLWAALALEKTGIEVDVYLPYLIASADSYQEYLPSAFLHMIVDFGEFGSKLITQQEFNYWEADNSAYGKYYDTSLALLALDTTKQEQVINAQNWLTNTAPDADGCWNDDNIRDTAMALWALERNEFFMIPTTEITYCTTSGFFCIASASCPTEERLSNYVCSTGTCCKDENLQACSELYGNVCDSGEQCSGLVERASDTDNCCTGTCEVPEELSECASSGGTCRTSCLSTQTEKSLDCDTSSQVCCKTTTTTSSGGSLWWLWLLLVLLIILIAFAIWKREQIKVWVYKKKSGFKEGSGSSSNGMPPTNPGNPMIRPQQRPGVRPLPTMMQRPPMQQQRFPPQQNPQQRRPL